MLKENDKTNLLHNKYFKKLRRKGLTAQSPSLAGITHDCFAL